MRRTYTADGEPIDLGSRLLPDEEVTKRAREYMLKTGEKDFTTIKAKTTANRDVRVIVSPVLNAPKILSFNTPSLLFRILVVRRISVSTE